MERDSLDVLFWALRGFGGNTVSRIVNSENIAEQTIGVPAVRDVAGQETSR